MDNASNYKDLHSQARAIVARELPEDFGGDHRVFEVLMEIEAIREAVKCLMGIAGAEFATDLLLCIVLEAQQVKLQRLPEMDIDPCLFGDCSDDEFVHTFTRLWLTRPHK